MKRELWIIALSICLFVACNRGPEPPSFNTSVSVSDLMKGIVDPAADVLWASVGTIITEESVEEIYPRDDAEWAVVRNATITLMESGNLLMVGDRAQSTGPWMEMAKALIDAGEIAKKAAESKDPEEIFAIGGVVYAACNNCHGTYWVDDPRQGL